MKNETIQKILVSLKQEADIKRTALMAYVENARRKERLNELVDEYRAVYNALVDFEIWMESLEEEQGTKMATCKDCLHFRVCKAIADTGKFTLDIDRTDQSERCPIFAGKMGWIPISDRLPGIDQKVLIYTKTEIITCGWYTEAHGLAYNKGFETESGFVWLGTASYWMPLPEPPDVEHETN